MRGGKEPKLPPRVEKVETIKSSLKGGKMLKNSEYFMRSNNLLSLPGRKKISAVTRLSVIFHLEGPSGLFFFFLTL